MALPYMQPAYPDEEHRNPLGALLPPGGGYSAPPQQLPTEPPPDVVTSPSAPAEPQQTPPPSSQLPGFDSSGNQIPSYEDLLAPGALGQASQQAQPPPFDLPPPPQRVAPDEGPAVLGTVLDVLLNKGRNVPQMIAQFGSPDDTAYENWKRNADYAKTRYALTAPRRYGAGALSPLQAALQAERLRQGRDRLGLSTSDEARKQQALKDAQAHWAALHDPTSSESEGYRQIAIAAGVDPNMVANKSADQVQKLAPSINYGAERTGTLAAADTAHTAARSRAEAMATEQPKIETAAGISAATLGDRIKIAQAQADAQGVSRAQSMELARLAALTATRNMGEAELHDGIADMIDMLEGRPGGAAGTKALQILGQVTGIRAALLPDEARFNLTKQMMVDAAEKMVTGGVPHAEAVRSMIEQLPAYGTAGAAEQYRRAAITLDKLGRAGSAALQETKEAPVPVKRPQVKPSAAPAAPAVHPAAAPTATGMTPEEEDELRGLGIE